MSIDNYLLAALLVVKRIFLVLLLAVPALLFLMLASAFGPGVGGFGILVTLALCGLGWALLPMIHVGKRAGLVCGVLWLALALWHAVAAGVGVTGEVLMCWLFATLFLALKLRAQPPGYFPEGWRAAASTAQRFDNEA